MQRKEMEERVRLLSKAHRWRAEGRKPPDAILDLEKRIQEDRRGANIAAREYGDEEVLDQVNRKIREMRRQRDDLLVAWAEGNLH